MRLGGSDALNPDDVSRPVRRRALSRKRSYKEQLTNKSSPYEKCGA
jgi:hypothetical protein